MCTSPEIFYLPIAKSGSTFTKNVLWMIEHGACYPHPKLIHRSNEKFRRASEAGASLDDIRNSETAFTVFRDPVSRFKSLYFDKVVGAGAARFAPLRDHLTKHHDLRLPIESDDDHRWNMRVLAEFIHLNLLGKRGLRINPHWTPQSRRTKLMAALDLKVFVSDHLDEQMRFLLRPVLPNIDDVLAIAERNRSTKSVGELGPLGTETLGFIEEIYQMDSAIHEAALAEWTASQRIPRTSKVLSKIS